MTYREMMDRAHDALKEGENDESRVLALLAIADRLDRLCEIMSSKGGNRPRWREAMTTWMCVRCDKNCKLRDLPEDVMGNIQGLYCPYAKDHAEWVKDEDEEEKMTEEKPTMDGERVCENTMKETREYKWEPSVPDGHRKCDIDYMLNRIRHETMSGKTIFTRGPGGPKVATIECEVMERALTYIYNLFDELEQAILNSEPIKQGIYLERLRNAILSQREEMVRRQVEARE